MKKDHDEFHGLKHLEKIASGISTPLLTTNIQTIKLRSKSFGNLI
jgi:hypothetical protein